MEFEWDEAKRRSNFAKHGYDFADAGNLDWKSATIVPDRRAEYGEHRFQAFAMWSGELHQVTFTLRQQAIRIFSFRRANRKERRLYGP